MNLSSINLRFFANIAPLVSGLNKAERAMDRAGKKMQAVGKNLTMKVTAPIVGLGAVAVNTFQGFELQMAKVKAVSGATGAEFEALSKNAKDLGASTIFSAKQVAELQTEFAKLGFTADEILKVTEATLALAQATDSDLARAAEVAGSTLRAFQLDASETERVTDVMAKSFSTSALDMETFAESMKYVASGCKSAGLSIEETTAMLAVMAKAGIKGSQAGTSLRRIISDLGAGSEPVTRKNQTIGAAGIGLADAKDEVGRSAQTALLVLAGSVDKLIR
jgi:TP901 family phage tail tape measure protein